MTTQEKMKTVKVRSGMQGFYGRVYESGEVLKLPASIPQTKSGWFDDVAESEAVKIAAASVGTKSINIDTTSEGPNPNVGNLNYAESVNSAAIQEVIKGDKEAGASNELSASESLQEQGVSETQPASGEGQPEQQSESTAQGTTNEPDEDEVKKVPTKAQIIAELEELGVQDFVKSDHKDVLLNKLNMVKEALGNQGE